MYLLVLGVIPLVNSFYLKENSIAKRALPEPGIVFSSLPHT